MIQKTIQILTNINCNLDCDYCYEKKHDRVNSIDDIKKYIDFKFEEFSNEPIPLTIEFIGGESLLYVELLEEIMQYIFLKNRTATTKHNITFSLSTNGTLIATEPKVKEFLIKYKNLLYMGVSLDGIKEIHDKHRIYKTNRQGCYDDVVAALAWLKDNYPMCKVGLKGTFVHDTVDRLSESVINMLQFGAKNDIGSNPVYEETWTIEDGAKITTQLFKIIDYVYDNNLEKEIKLFHIMTPEPEHYGNKFVKENRNYCGSCVHMQCIGFDKKIYGCNRFCTANIKGLEVGYMDENNINITNQKLIDEVEVQYKKYPTDCQECDLHSYCAACIAMPYELQKDPSMFLSEKRMCGWTYAQSLARFYQKRKHLEKYKNVKQDHVCQKEQCQCKKE